MVFSLLLLLQSSFAGPGDWPEPRQNGQLTALQPMAGAMRQAPKMLARLDMASQAAPVAPVDLGGNRGKIGITVVGGTLAAYRPDGSPLWSCHPIGINFVQLIAAADFDHSGRILLALEAGRPTPPFGAAVLVRAEDGTVAWRYDVDPMSYVWNLSVGSYLPASPDQQMVVLMQGYPPDKQNGYIAMFKFPAAGAMPVKAWRYDFDQYTCYPQLRQVNLYGDARRELAVISHSRMWLFNPVTGKKDKFLQWDVSPANVRSYGLDEFADLTHSGHDDFLCIANFSQHHEVLLNSGGVFQEAWHQGWNESVTTGHVATSWPIPAHGDIDGSGHESIVLSMFDSQGENKWLIRIYDAVTGRLTYSMPGMIAVSLVDVGGSGGLGILADISDDSTAARPDGSADPSDHKGACLLRCVNGKRQSMWQDSDAHAVRGTTKSGPAVVLRGQPMVLRQTAGGAFVATAYFAPAAKPTVSADFSAVHCVIGPSNPELLAADFYGTGHNDLLVFREGLATILRAQRHGSLQALANYPTVCLPAVIDPQGDGHVALVLVQAGPGIVPLVKAVRPRDGQVLWEGEFTEPVEGLAAPRIAYARQGHFTGRRGTDVYLWLGSPAVRSMVLDGRDGKIMWQKQRFDKIERYWGPSVNLASVWSTGGNGKEDLVFTSPDYFCIADGRTGALIRGPSFPPDIFHQPSQGLYTFPAILPAVGAAESDPQVALVGGHYFQGVMSLRCEPNWYKLPPIGAARSGAEGFAHDQQGQWIMGYGRQDGKFACVHAADGSSRWDYDVGASCSDAISCDVGGSGREAFVFGTSHGDLLALEDHVSSAKLLWKTNIGCPIIGSPIAADLLGEGHSQLVVCGVDGRVVLLGM